MADFLFIPGDKLSPVITTSTGSGDYIRGSYIFASLCCEVKSQERKSVFPSVVIPQKGSVVLCRVISVGQSFAKVSILSVGSQVLNESLQGIIRREEVRAAEKDKISLFLSFRPRDIVRARVLSLGEAHSYTLTTAENELGVVLAKSSHGGHMTPVSWCEMQCVITGCHEKRKVAKVVNSV